MLKLLKLAIVLVSILLGLIFIVRQIGRTQPADNQFALFFTDANGDQCPRLCIIGVTVGMTPVSEVASLFAKHPLTRGMEIREVSNAVQALNDPELTILGTRFTATYDSPIGVVDQMSWYKRSDGTPNYAAADVIMTLGEPDCILTASSQSALFYVKPRLLVSVDRLNGFRFNPHDPVNIIVMYDASGVPNCEDVYVSKWRGFASYHRYNNMP